MPVPSPAHREVQAIAKAVAAQIADTITPASTERTISETAQRMLAERGLSDTWYYQCPALVLLGSRSCLSVSGWAYAPGEEPVGEFNLVTIDLSPRRGPWWGDCARSFFVEQGIARLVPSAAEFREGHRCITELHAQMQEFVSVSTTFQQLYAFANERIEAAGYESLDFAGSVGHSVDARTADCVYIERNNRSLLSEVSCFTFGPHIRAAHGRWGFKHENIYFFNDRGLVEEL